MVLVGFHLYNMECVARMYCALRVVFDIVDRDPTIVEWVGARNSDFYPTSITGLVSWEKSYYIPFHQI